jgi:hypothetical protein
MAMLCGEETCVPGQNECSKDYLPSMGFQDIAFEEKFRIVFAISWDVRRSYRTIDLSIAADASIDVSIWL